MPRHFKEFNFGRLKKIRLAYHTWHRLPDGYALTNRENRILAVFYPSKGLRRPQIIYGRDDNQIGVMVPHAVGRKIENFLLTHI